MEIKIRVLLLIIALLAVGVRAEESVIGLPEQNSGFSQPPVGATSSEINNQFAQVRQETRSLRELTNLRVAMLEREVEKSSAYVQNLLLAFLISGCIVIYLVLNTIRHQSRVNNHRVRQLIRESEGALQEMNRMFNRPEAEHFQLSRRLSKIMHSMREDNSHISQKSVSDIYAAAEDPTLPVTLHYQANAIKHEQSAEWPEAISLWEKLQNIDDGNPDVLLHLAHCYKNLADLATGVQAGTYRDYSLRYFQIYSQKMKRNQGFVGYDEQVISKQAYPPQRQAPVIISAQPQAVSPTIVVPPPSQPVSQVPSSSEIVKNASKAIAASATVANKLGSTIARAASEATVGMFNRVKPVNPEQQDSFVELTEEEKSKNQASIVPIISPLAVDDSSVVDKSANKNLQVSSQKNDDIAIKPQDTRLQVKIGKQKDPLAASEEVSTVDQPKQKPVITVGPTTNGASKTNGSHSNGYASPKAKQMVNGNGSVRSLAKPVKKSPPPTTKSTKPTKNKPLLQEFNVRLDNAQECLVRFGNVRRKSERNTWLFGAIEELEIASKHGSSARFYSIWGLALIEAAQLKPQEKNIHIRKAIEKFKQCEKIKPRTMTIELATAYALLDEEDECRLVLERNEVAEIEDLKSQLETDAFENVRNKTWFGKILTASTA